MQVSASFPIVEEILQQYRDVINQDFDGYKNHVTRMLNFCHYLLPDHTHEESQKLQIAAAFHDIALWTHDRVDYLVPSYQVCHDYLDANNLSEWKDELQIMIDMHHLLGSYNGQYSRLVEVFRRADLIDFSFGVITFGVDKQYINAVKQALPNHGFHKALLGFTFKQLRRNPFNPMPMIRLSNIYQKD